MNKYPLPGLMLMDLSIKGIISLLVVTILGELLSKLSAKLYRKYKILEHGLTIRVFFLFLWGLLLIVMPLVFLLIFSSNGVMPAITFLSYIVSIFIGILLLIILVWMVVYCKTNPDENLIVSNANPHTISVIMDVKPSRFQRFIRNFLFIVGGFIFTAAIVYLLISLTP